jgi:hypothetical protein
VPGGGNADGNADIADIAVNAGNAVNDGRDRVLAIRVPEAHA